VESSPGNNQKKGFGEQTSFESLTEGGWRRWRRSRCTTSRAEPVYCYLWHCMPRCRRLAARPQKDDDHSDRQSVSKLLSADMTTHTMSASTVSARHCKRTRRRKSSWIYSCEHKEPTWLPLHNLTSKRKQSKKTYILAYAFPM